ncbi:hypothetical protein DYB36_005860 [Aphanomyces astaci]|uniref:Endonuclease/exonuclease/phosphatase domain-containing protein n=1 Tax=Aphanomyces astaci TaxID=112090 RepID=A0A397AXI0_APHAT|nr:hypothetical protein DYB36_005860 [Aphanomyces astaci]
MTSSGASRSSLDYTKVIRGFSAAAKQHTKAAFVPPPADAIEAILFELTKPKKDRVDILAKINLARPYTPKVATARFTVDTGDALANQSHEAIMSSLFASTQTDTVKSVLSEFVQVTRLGRGGIMVSVTSSNARKALGGQYLSIMGKKYIIPVHEEHPLDSLCFMDITGIRDNFDATQFYRKLTQLGVDVVYHSHRAVIPGTGCHTNTWRVYFADAAIPVQLQINGEPVNQIKYQRFYYRVYFKGTKGTAFHSVNGVSTHCVDIEAKRQREETDDSDIADTNTTTLSRLLHTTVAAPKKAKKGTNATQSRENTVTTESNNSDTVPSPRPFQSSLQRSIRPEESSHSSRSAPSKHVSVFEDDGEVDMDAEDTFTDTHMSMEVDVPFQVVSGRRKRKGPHRSPPKTLSEFATANFFEVLRTYNGGFDTIKWKDDQDIVTMIPTFQPRILPEEQRNQCITTMQVIDNNVTFDVELMTIGRLHLILEDSIELLQTEDLADMERTFAEAVADGLGSITEHVNTGQADKVWAQVQKKHLSANVALHGMAASDPTMFESVIQLHTWQRWFAASTDTNVQSFSNTYKQLYGSTKLGFAQLYHHRGEIKAGTAAGSTEPLTPTQILVEDALSLFELWLSIMAPTFFKRDAWVLCLTGKPVIWLTTGTGRLLTPNTLLLILRSALGNSVLQRLVRHLPDHALVQQLTVMSEWTHVYGEDQTLSVRQEGTDRVLRLVQLGLSGLAKTKLKDSHHLSTFTYHIQHAIGHGKYFIAVNDPRVHPDYIPAHDDDPAHRSGGVALVFDDTVPGFHDLRHMSEHDVPYKYMVVSTQWQETPVYFHCVYAPVRSAERAAYFDSLPRDFPEDSIHLVMGDLNLPMDLYLDVERQHSDHNVGRVNCLEWLAALRVTDAWRMHHDESRTYSGPHKRTRLDYIFADTHLVRDCYVSSGYQRPDAHVAGDHAIHTLVLEDVHQTMGKGYWKMPKELVQYPQVREAIATEASRLLHYIRTAHNPGVVWHAWKKRTRRFLQDAHRFVRSHYMREKATAAGRLTEARRLHTEGHSTDQDLAEEEKIYVETEDLWKLYYSDLKFDVHAGKNERSTAHFFRPPTKLLYKTPVRSVNQRDGTVSTDPDDIQREFVDHWTRLVSKYCAVSGAKLNIDKTEILVLNSNQPIPFVHGLSFAASGRPIRYLGILLGHNLPAGYQVNRLTDKLYETFQTIQHALRTCSHVRPLWDIVSAPWLQFGLSFEWTYILDITKLQPAQDWSHVATELTVLWTMLAGGVLRRLWIYRNTVKYESANNLHIPSVLELVLLNWSAQVRRHIQLPSTLGDERNRFQAILNRLGQDPSYRGFWTKYPFHLSVNPLTRRLPLK